MFWLRNRNNYFLCTPSELKALSVLSLIPVVMVKKEENLFIINVYNLALSEAPTLLSTSTLYRSA